MRGRLNEMEELIRVRLMRGALLNVRLIRKVRIMKLMRGKFNEVNDESSEV